MKFSVGSIIKEVKSTPNGASETVEYKILVKLGVGAFGTCSKVENLKSKYVSACKVIHKDSLTKPKSKKAVMNELKIHRGIKNPNICFFENWFEDQENIYLILELCPNESLF